MYQANKADLGLRKTEEIKSKEDGFTPGAVETFVYKKEDDAYEGGLTFEKQKVKLRITKVMEAFYWVGEFCMEDLVVFNNKWRSLLDTETVYGFMILSFRNSDVIMEETIERELKIEFKYQMGYSEVLLPIIIKREKADIDQIIIKQGALIKSLNKKCEEMGQEIKGLSKRLKKYSEAKRKIAILFKESDGNPISTHDPNFVDVPGKKPAELSIASKSKVKWTLHVNGLNFVGTSGKFLSKFRLEVASVQDGQNNYWPSKDGYTNYEYDSSKPNASLSFSFGDVTELNEGKYTVKLQWAFSSNNEAIKMMFDPKIGCMIVIVEIF